MLGLPREPWLLAAAFLSARFFDIVKPPPARRLQALGGGLGVAIDDILASLYSLAANWAFYLAVQWWLARPA
jgi:phosphatidylglycerophosphatase A